MPKTPMLLILATVCALLPALAEPQQESLGDLARQLREQRDKDSKKAAKVFTNDNLPAPPPEEAAPAAAPEEGKKPDSGESAAKPASPDSSQEKGGTEPESPADKVKTRGYWQAKFIEARQDLAHAKEHQQLAEDELNLLQIQQVRELDPAAKRDLTAKVQAKQSEVETDRAATNAAQKALDDLEREFRESGAPDDWSVTT